MQAWQARQANKECCTCRKLSCLTTGVYLPEHVPRAFCRCQARHGTGCPCRRGRSGTGGRGETDVEWAPGHRFVAVLEGLYQQGCKCTRWATEQARRVKEIKHA